VSANAIEKKNFFFYLSGTHKISNKPSTEYGKSLRVEIWRTDARYSLDEDLPASDFILQLFYLRFGQPMSKKTNVWRLNEWKQDNCYILPIILC
jgi:hypothetical protein